MAHVELPGVAGGSRARSGAVVPPSARVIGFAGKPLTPRVELVTCNEPYTLGRIE